MDFFYARVSTAGQCIDRQIEDAKRLGIDERNIYQEKESGAKADRKELNNLISHLRDGDTLYVSSLDRLARSTQQLISLSEEFQQLGVNLVSLKEMIDTTTPQGRFYFTVMSAIAQMEREIIRERQAEGIAIAKAKGKMTGRPKVKNETIEAALTLYTSNPDMSVREIASTLGISHSKIYAEIKSRGITR